MATAAAAATTPWCCRPPLLKSPLVRNPNPSSLSRTITPKFPRTLTPSFSISASSSGGGGSVKKEQKMTCEGLVTEALPSCMFRVQLHDTGDVVLGYLSGKMQKNKIIILPGDTVHIEIDRYDSTRGRITYRLDSRSRTKPKPPTGGKGGGRK